LAFFEAENRGDRDVTGIATYNVAPDRVSDVHYGRQGRLLEMRNDWKTGFRGGKNRIEKR